MAIQILVGVRFASVPWRTKEGKQTEAIGWPEQQNQWQRPGKMERVAGQLQHMFLPGDNRLLKEDNSCVTFYSRVFF